MRKDRVLCVTKSIEESYDEDELLELQYKDIDIQLDESLRRRVKLIIPLYDHPHNDIENGQPHVHWHQNHKYNGDFDKLLHFECYKGGRISKPKIAHGEKFEYIYLYKISEFETFKTPVHLTSKTKLKHNCIHKGKCPHRGYDLSEELAVYDENYGGNVITCPLHGLKFNAETKEIINNHLRQLTNQ